MIDIQKITEFIENKVRSLGFIVEEVSIKDAGRNLIVKVVIDRLDRFISVGDCTYVSRSIENQLEEMIEKSFILEVSSPGADRELKKESDFERFKGMYVQILSKNGNKIVGKLMGKVEDRVYILPKDSKKILDFHLKDIVKINLYPLLR